jgi:hypothetical protein
MRGWLWLAAFVGAYDAWAGLTQHPTLSAEFRTATRDHPVPVCLATAYMLAHLFGAMPRHVDPLTQYTRLFGRLGGKSIF